MGSESSGSDSPNGRTAMGGLTGELRGFAARVAVSMVSLDVALYFQSNPTTVDTPAGLSDRVYGSAHDIGEALSHLVEVGLLTQAILGAGAYPVYALTEDPAHCRLLGCLSDAYHKDPVARTEIIRGVVLGWDR